MDEKKRTETLTRGTSLGEGALEPAMLNVPEVSAPIRRGTPISVEIPAAGDLELDETTGAWYHFGCRTNGHRHSLALGRVAFEYWHSLPNIGDPETGGGMSYPTLLTDPGVKLLGQVAFLSDRDVETCLDEAKFRFFRLREPKNDNSGADGGIEDEIDLRINRDIEIAKLLTQEFEARAAGAKVEHLHGSTPSEELVIAQLRCEPVEFLRRLSYRPLKARRRTDVPIASFVYLMKYSTKEEAEAAQQLCVIGHKEPPPLANLDQYQADFEKRWAEWSEALHERRRRGTRADNFKGVPAPSNWDQND